MNLGLKGKRVIVTGGNRGIGRCCALALAREGARICITARDKKRLSNTLVEITEALKQTGNKLFFARGHGVYALRANLMEAWGHAATFEHSMRILYLSELADL